MAMISASLRNHSHVMIRSCKGRLDSYMGTLISRELSISSTWYLIGTQEDHTCILIHTGEAVIESKILADNHEGVTGTK